MKMNFLRNLSETSKTIILALVTLYLSFALALYQIWDSSPPGIIGGLFTSIAALINTFIGIGAWFIIILMYIQTAIRLKIISPINVQRPILIVTFVAFSGLSEDGVIGEIINGLFGSLFGESIGKAIQIIIFLLSSYIILRGSENYIPNLFKLKDRFQKKNGKKKESSQTITSVQNDEDNSKDYKNEKKLSPAKVNRSYSFPDLALLDSPQSDNEIDSDFLKMRAKELEKAIMPFEYATVSKWIPGPMATIFYTKLEADSKVSKLLSRSNDIARSLGLPDDSVRISGNIEGEKNTIGIELPNPKRSFCSIRAVLEHQSYSKSSHSLPLALGIGIDGEYVCEDLSALPHLLLAGSTGSGKTVALNAILLSLIYKKSPAELNLVLIDPKMVEFSLYKGIPHLLGNVVTDMDESVQILHELVEEMELRYQKFQDVQVTKIADYNESAGDRNKMPHIVVFVDELGDLMLSHGKRVEDLLGRLSQKARAAGIHLVLATQRPTSDIIKGLIKANVPARLAFKVSNQVDSRVILDSKGAESMMGKGDSLLLTTGNKSLKRIQSPLVTTNEIKKVVSHIS